MKLLKLILLGLFLISCTTQDGYIVGSNINNGTLYLGLENSPESARIFINNRDTGKLTPASIELSPGEYGIKLFCPGFETNPDSINIIIEEKQLLEHTFKVSPVASGTMVINSDQAGINVIINGMQFGTTPFQVDGFAVGKYHIELLKPGYYPEYMEIDIKANVLNKSQINLKRKTRVFLLEHFSNINCNPCAVIDVALEKIIAETDSIEIIGIGYHPNFPSEEDPFYVFAQEENDGRRDYYNVSRTPTVLLDGISIPAFSPSYVETKLTEQIQSRLEIEDICSEFYINISNSFNNISGSVLIKAKTDFEDNITLRIILIEKEIEYENSPGTNGITHFKDIMRSGYPDINGQNVTLLENESASIDFNFERNSSWEKIQIVAFLQNDDTEEIFMATKSMEY